MNRALRAVCALVLLGAGMLATVAQEFQVVVPETPKVAGTYQPIERYLVDGTFGTMARISDIPPDLTADPASVAFRTPFDMFVANRAGHTGNSSISRFTFDPTFDSFTKIGDITGNGVTDAVQLAFDTVTGELFQTNWHTGVLSRFLFDSSGNPIPNGTIAMPDGDYQLGVAVRRADLQLFVSSYSGVRRFARNPDGSYSYVTTFSIPGYLVHFIKFRDDEMYVCEISTSTIYRYRFDSGGNPYLYATVYSYHVIDVAFSPNGQEMFAANHLDGGLTRYRYDAPTDSWIQFGDVIATPSLGGLATTYAYTATVSGNVFLDLYGGGAGIGADLEFRAPGTQTVLYSAPIVLDVNGDYSAMNVPLGAYDVAVKFPNWLRQVATGVTVGSTGATVDFDLANGDAWSDNKVDLLDLSTVLANFGSTGAPPIDGDLTWDGKVDLLDLSCVLANFGLHGDA